MTKSIEIPNVTIRTAFGFAPSAPPRAGKATPAPAASPAPRPTAKPASAGKVAAAAKPDPAKAAHFRRVADAVVAKLAAKRDHDRRRAAEQKIMAQFDAPRRIAARLAAGDVDLTVDDCVELFSASLALLSAVYRKTLETAVLDAYARTREPPDVQEIKDALKNKKAGGEGPTAIEAIRVILTERVSELTGQYIFELARAVVGGKEESIKNAVESLAGHFEWLGTNK